MAGEWKEETHTVDSAAIRNETKLIQLVHKVLKRVICHLKQV
jgi:hypothetical protein